MNSGGRVIRKEMPEEQSSESAPRNNITGTVLIRDDEMRNFVNEWMKTGYGDLVIDENLCNRLIEYADFKKQFAQTMANLLEQELERYIIDERYVLESCGVANFVIGDNKVLLKAEVFVDHDIGYETTDWDAKIMKMHDFKRLLASLGNRMISYAFMFVEEEIYFDFFLYCKEMGIDIKTKTSKSGENKNIELILPDDWGNKNA